MPCGYLCACFPSTKVERLVDILLRLNFGLGPASLPSKMQQNIEIFPYDWTVFLSTYEYCEVCCPGINKKPSGCCTFPLYNTEYFPWWLQRFMGISVLEHVCVSYFVFCTLCWGLAKAVKGHTVTERSVSVFMILKCWLQHIFLSMQCQKQARTCQDKKIGWGHVFIFKQYMKITVWMLKQQYNCNYYSPAIPYWLLVQGVPAL